MKKVIITGATSMIGVALIDECVANNVEVLAVVRKNSSRLNRLPSSPLVRICECELDSLTSLATLDERFDVFYHFAWYTGKANRDNPLLQSQNIKYTLEAVELAKKLGCGKFIGAGSQAEYGMVTGVLDENVIPNPKVSYGIAKYTAGLLSEKLCSMYGITHIWARICSVYGKYDKEETMVNYAIDRFLHGEKAFFSAGTQYWNYLYERDAGKIFYLIGKEICSNRVFRVAHGNSEPLKNFIMKIIKFFPFADYEFEEKSSENCINLMVNTDDLFGELDFVPSVSFEDGIQEIISYKLNK